MLSEIARSGQPGYLSLPTRRRRAAGRPPADGPLADRRPAVATPPSLAAFHAPRPDLLAGAAPPVVLADILVHRAHAEAELHALPRHGAGCDYASLLWGRRVIDESRRSHLGTYVGAASEPAVRDGGRGRRRA